MLVTKLKIATAVLIVAALAATSAGLLSLQSQAAGTATESKKKSDAPTQKSAAKSTYVVKVPSPSDGVVLFIGTEIKEGENVPPERLITVQVGREKKKFRRLKKGDPVKEGQLLARLDDRLARAELAMKESKINASKFDFLGAEAIAKEAENKFEAAQRAYERKAIPLEDYNNALLTRIKMSYDANSKKQSARLAELELGQVQTTIELHEIRSSVSGVIAAIHRHPGEGVRRLETVFEIEVTDVASNTEGSAQTKKKAEIPTYLVKVPSEVDGVMLFIGTEIKEGENVPPEKLIAVLAGGEKKKFRRLAKGDSVKEGQLLAQLDDRLARAELAVKESKVRASEFEFVCAKAIAEEAENKYETAQRAFDRRAIPLEELQNAQVTRDKMAFDAKSKKEAAKLAEMDFNLTRLKIKQYEIRSKVSGVISRIHKHPGEAVRRLQTVFEIEVTENKE